MRTDRYVAEFLGTALLVFIAVGSAVLGLPEIGAVGVALAFGLVLLGLVYAIGPISGCHVNPAVTAGAWIMRQISGTDAVCYIVAQVLGGIAGAALIKLVSSVGGVETAVDGANAYGPDEGINAAGTFVLEVVLTFVFVFVVLLVVRRKAAATAAGVAIGFTLAVVHLVGVPLHGTSVNPARSIGPALFAGGEAIGQLWLFILAPLVGGVLAALAARALRDAPEDTEVEMRRIGAPHADGEIKVKPR
ncbi:aquaporin [Actinocorallia populi]|uniref:aquaporin n=1 Tax=Actinocorallia populi TaxID=2079200 RepID=UPI000D093F51|nr:aquaporin [Actinocorallia populi]